MISRAVFRASHDALPFQTCDDLLLLTFDPDIFSDTPTIQESGIVHLSDKAISECRSCIRFQFDLVEANKRLELEPHQLIWTAVAKDPQLRRIATMDQGRFESNEDIITRLLDPYASFGLVGAGGIRLELLITLAESLSSQSGRPKAKGTVLARRVVELRYTIREGPFPIQYSDTAWFLNRGLPMGTLWWLDLIKGATPETDPAAAIRVTLSESMRSVLNGTERGSPLARSYADYVASDMLSELVRVVMELQGDAPFPEDAHGLLGHLAKAFAYPSKDSLEILEELRQWHQREPGRIRAEAQQRLASIGAFWASNFKDTAA